MPTFVELPIEFRFDRLRTEYPGRYEAAADIDTDEWIRLRIEVHGRLVRALVTGVVCLAPDVDRRSIRQARPVRGYRHRRLLRRPARLRSDLN